MPTLPDDRPRVHSNPDHDLDDAPIFEPGPCPDDAVPEPFELFEPLDDDLAWWAEKADQLDREDLADTTDLAWLMDERLERLERSRGEDVDALVAWCLSAAISALAFHRFTSAADFARGRIDLGRLHAPAVGSRRSRLARELDVQASWYLHLDTAAGQLAAWHLLMQAGLADEMGSNTVADWRLDEAAWRAAAIESVMEA